MRSTFIIVFILACIVALMPRQSSAQDRPPSSSDPILPDIAPREVEIRGELEIRFPSLQRQPLIGFNPPPRIPTLPPDRIPFVEPYKQTNADLPPSPLQRPEAPPAVGATTYPPEKGELAAWGGRYYSRGVRARLGTALSEVASFAARLDYAGRDGHQPYPNDPDVLTPADVFEGNVGIQVNQSTVAFSFSSEGYYENYTLYGAQPGSADLLSEPVRKGGGGAGTLRVRTLTSPTADVDFGFTYGATRYQTRRYEDTNRPGSILVKSQQHLAFDGDVGVPTDFGRVWIAGKVLAAGLGPDTEHTLSVSAGAGIRYDATRFRARLGARVLGAIIDEQPEDDTEDPIRQTLFSPDVRLDVFLMPGLQLYAENRPHTVSNALGDLYRENPYLVTEPLVIPTLYLADAEGGVRFYRGPFEVTARGGLELQRRHRIFERALGNADGYVAGLWQTRYADAQIIQVGADFSAVLPGGVHAQLSGTYRHGRLTFADTVIPYFAPFVADASISASFNESRGLIQLSGTFESLRYVDDRMNAQADPYLDLDLYGAYNLTAHIGIIARIDHISLGYADRWPRYPESQAIVGAGIRVFW